MVVIWAWPMRSMTDLRSEPPARSQLAWAWRRSWRRTGRVSVALCRDTSPHGPGDTLVVHAEAADGGQWLATHARSALPGGWIVDPDHWAGLPDGHTRSTTTCRDVVDTSARAPVQEPEPLHALLRRRGLEVAVTSRPLADYDQAAAVVGQVSA